MLLDPSRYNRQIRPGFGKKQVNVTLNLSVLGIGPVDEMTQVAKKYISQEFCKIRWNFSISVLHARLLLPAILGRREALLFHRGPDGVVSRLEDS